MSLCVVLWSAAFCKMLVPSYTFILSSFLLVFFFSATPYSWPQGAHTPPSNEGTRTTHFLPKDWIPSSAEHRALHVQVAMIPVMVAEEAPSCWSTVVHSLPEAFCQSPFLTFTTTYPQTSQRPSCNRPAATLRLWPTRTGCRRCWRQR